MHKSSPLCDMSFDLGMLDPIECPSTPKLAYATPTICSPLPMKPPALQWHGTEMSRSPSPLSPISPTSESSGRSSPTTDSDSDLPALSTPKDNASNAEKAQGSTHLHHPETPPPQQPRGYFHAAVQNVPGHARKCSLRLACCEENRVLVRARHTRAAPYPSVYASARQYRGGASLCDRYAPATYGCHCVVYETPHSTAESRTDMPSVTKWLQGISLGNGLIPPKTEPFEDVKQARWPSDAGLGLKHKARHIDDAYEDLQSIKPVEQVGSDGEDGATVYYTSHDASTDTEYSEEESTVYTGDLILTPYERKALLHIHETEWDELFQEITAATALPLRRRPRPGECNAPLVPSPLSVDPDCADEIVDTVLPTYAKGVWPSYRRKLRPLEEEPDR